MGAKSGIEWTDATWNPTLGCTKIAAPCRNCYIVTTPPYRIRGLKFDKHGSIPVEVHPERLDLPLTWRAPRRIFVDSLSDLFHEDVPTSFIAAVYASMALASWHTFQMLTKRPARRRELLNSASFRDEVCVIANTRRLSLGTDKGYRGHDLAPMTFDRWPLPNVWEGVTTGTQRDVDAFVPLLLDTRAAIRFLSCEPLLEPLDLTIYTMAYAGDPEDGEEYYRLPRHAQRLHWVIAGGESGPQIAGPRATVGGARRALVGYVDDRGWLPKAHALEMVRNLRDQCIAAGVAFHFKQWGGPRHDSGGRALDGRTWDQLPVEPLEVVR